jgi:hypothetical protein
MKKRGRFAVIRYDDFEEAIEEAQPKEEPLRLQKISYRLCGKGTTTELSLEPIPVARVTKTNNQLLDPTVERYVPYRERTEMSSHLSEAHTKKLLPLKM